MVLARDVLWSIDATHLVRDEEGACVQAEVVRETASTRTIGLSVGPPARGADVIALLKHTAAERGGLPLVLSTDNSAAYVVKGVEQWLASERVVHLTNLPRTPQHNACAEHGIGELKADAEVKLWPKDALPERALDALIASADHLDGQRLRASRGWRTAIQTDQEDPS